MWPEQLLNGVSQALTHQQHQLQRSKEQQKMELKKIPAEVDKAITKVRQTFENNLREYQRGLRSVDKLRLTKMFADAVNKLKYPAGITPFKNPIGPEFDALWTQAADRPHILV